MRTNVGWFVKVEVLGSVSRTQQNKGHFRTLRFQKTDAHALDIAWLRKSEVLDLMKESHIF